MKKYKLLYFVSEDKYFLTHKIDHILNVQGTVDVLVICKKTLTKNHSLFKSVEIKYFDFDRKTFNPIKIIIEISKLLKIIKSFKPDIIHNTAMKPIVFGSIVSCFNPNINVINSIVGLGYVYINKNLKTFLLRVFLKIFFRSFLKRKNFITVFQNNDDKRFFENICKINEPVLIRGSGVNIKKFCPNVSRKTYDLIFHSRMLRDKGIFELINVIRNIKKKISLNVLFVGNPDNQNYASICSTDLTKWQNEGLIDWKGYREDIAKLLNKSKIAILPSYREGFPKSLLEAASCGLPIIATDVPGCREICLDGYNGFLVKPKDEHSLEKAIMKLIKNKKLIIQFGLNSRSLVEKNFNVDLISKNFADLYDQVISIPRKVQLSDLYR